VAWPRRQDHELDAPVAEEGIVADVGRVRWAGVFLIPGRKQGRQSQRRAAASGQ